MLWAEPPIGTTIMRMDYYTKRSSITFKYSKGIEVGVDGRGDLHEDVLNSLANATQPQGTGEQRAMVLKLIFDRGEYYSPGSEVLILHRRQGTKLER